MQEQDSIAHSTDMQAATSARTDKPLSLSSFRANLIIIGALFVALLGLCVFFATSAYRANAAPAHASSLADPLLENQDLLEQFGFIGQVYVRLGNLLITPKDSQNKALIIAMLKSWNESFVKNDRDLQSYYQQINKTLEIESSTEFATRIQQILQEIYALLLQKSNDGIADEQETASHHTIIVRVPVNRWMLGSDFAIALLHLCYRLCQFHPCAFHHRLWPVDYSWHAHHQYSFVSDGK